jgi:hypothetical protein
MSTHLLRGCRPTNHSVFLWTTNLRVLLPQTTRTTHRTPTRNSHYLVLQDTYSLSQFPRPRTFLQSKTTNKRFLFFSFFFFGFFTALVLDCRTMHPCPNVGRDVVAPQIVAISWSGGDEEEEGKGKERMEPPATKPSYSYPPKSHSELPLWSIHRLASERQPGNVLVVPIPCVPYVPEEEFQAKKKKRMRNRRVLRVLCSCWLPF